MTYLKTDTDKFIRSLNVPGLSRQQKRTLKGQALSGDLTGAIKGYTKIMKKGEMKK